MSRKVSAPKTAGRSRSKALVLKLASSREAKSSTTWADVLPRYKPGESLEELVDRFLARNEHRSVSFFDNFLREVESNEFTSDLVAAMLEVGANGPAAVIAEMVRQFSHGSLTGLLETVERHLDELDANRRVRASSRGPNRKAVSA